MSTPRPLDPKTKASFDYAKSQGVTIEPFVERYGIMFTRKLLKALIRTKKNTRETVYLPLPRFKGTGEEREQAWKAHDQLLIDSGIKTKISIEDFIDEDTGEVVSIERTEFYTI